jgi:hypothetical protein
MHYSYRTEKTYCSLKAQDERRAKTMRGMNGANSVRSIPRRLTRRAFGVRVRRC